MPLFDYLAVFYSLIIGLAVARILSGLAALITHPKPVRWSPEVAAWGLFLLAFSAWEWWLISRWRQNEEWSFALYFFITLRPSLLYLATHILVPDFAERDEEIDLRAHFEKARKWVSLLFAVVVLLGFVDTALKGSAYFFTLLPRQLTVSGIAILLSLTAAFGRGGRVGLFVPVALLILYFIASVLL